MELLRKYYHSFTITHTLENNLEMITYLLPNYRDTANLLGLLSGILYLLGYRHNKPSIFIKPSNM